LGCDHGSVRTSDRQSLATQSESPRWLDDDDTFLGKQQDITDPEAAVLVVAGQTTEPVTTISATTYIRCHARLVATLPGRQVF